jgi:hypothetical protein
MKANTDIWHAGSKRYGLLLLLASSVLVVGGCKSLEVPSHWTNEKITVDGVGDEWSNRTVLLERGKLAVGILNDTDYLYVFLSTHDKALSREIMVEGLTLWFDPEAGQHRTFGIHYPLGLQSSGLSVKLDVGQPLASGLTSESTSSLLRNLEVLGPGKNDRRKMPVQSAEGIQAKADYANEVFACELRVPYIESNRYPYSVRAGSARMITVGFETPEHDIRVRDLAGSTDMGGGSGGGRRGGRSSGSSSGTDPERISGEQGPLKVWADVQLASSDSASTK